MTQSDLNQALEHSKPGRKFVAVESSHWGELILPAPDEQRVRSGSGLRVIVIAASNLGRGLLNGVISYEQERPDHIQMVAVSTDDAVEDTARIGMNKRIWRFYSSEDRLKQTADLIGDALQAGLPVYTGELKIDWFRDQLKEWMPDLIVVAGCGQILDKELLSIPRLGVINFHPADLPAGHGAGAQPYQDLADRADPWTRWTVHNMTTEVDAGPPIGVSCPIFAGDAQGKVTDNPNRLFMRMTEILPAMVEILLDEVIINESAPSEIDFVAQLPDELIRRMQLPLG